MAAAPAAHHRFLSAFFETQVCSQLREAVQSKHDAGSQDAAVRAFGAALREWRHCAGFTDGEGDTDEGAAADASSVRSDPTHQHPPATGAGSGSDAAAARRRTAAERRGATSAAGSVSGVHAAIVGRPGAELLRHHATLAQRWQDWGLLLTCLRDLSCVRVRSVCAVRTRRQNGRCASARCFLPRLGP